MGILPYSAQKDFIYGSNRESQLTALNSRWASALSQIAIVSMITGAGIGLGKTLKKYDPSGSISRLIETVSCLGILALAVSQTMPSCVIVGILAAGLATGIVTRC